MQNAFFFKAAFQGTACHQLFFLNAQNVLGLEFATLLCRQLHWTEADGGTACSLHHAHAALGCAITELRVLAGSQSLLWILYAFLNDHLTTL